MEERSLRAVWNKVAIALVFRGDDGLCCVVVVVAVVVMVVVLVAGLA